MQHDRQNTLSFKSKNKNNVYVGTYLWVLWIKELKIVVDQPEDKTSVHVGEAVLIHTNKERKRDKTYS